MEERRVDRREFLLAGVATGLVAAAPLNYAAIARAGRNGHSQGTFVHGVASGQPSPGSIQLWTRLSQVTRNSHPTLEVAKDSGFRKVIRREKVGAAKHDDFTVHTRVRGLKPDSQYFYRFHTDVANSPVGRFRTLPPPDSQRPIRIGFFSCQDHEAGYYTAHAALAGEPDLDLVICLGDYIYERHYYPGPAARVDRTGVNGDGNVQTLAEYRQKYRFYQTDPNLQAMHAAYSFVAVWDDHEVEDNYAGDDPDSAQPDRSKENNGTPRRVPFEERRRNGYKAFFEAMPRADIGPNVVYGSLRLGRLVELFLTDERRYRDPQPCNDAILTPCPAGEDPGRRMLGDRQKRWFKSGLTSSRATWKLWGSELMVMSLDIALGQHALQDAWDGYAAERREILTEVRNRNVKNLVVLSGDIHTMIAGHVSPSGWSNEQPVATELTGGSITSLGLPEFLGVPPATLEGIRLTADPHTIWANFERRGYGVLTVSPSELIGEMKAVSTTQSPTATSSTLARFRVPNGVPSIQQI